MTAEETKETVCLLNTYLHRSLGAIELVSTGVHVYNIYICRLY